jgi:hypothetical protein
MTDLVEEDAKKIFDDKDDISELKITKGKTLIIGIDGGWYHEYKTKKANLEAKTINCSTGAIWDDNQKRLVLENRVGYSKTEDIDDFKKSAYAFAVRNGLNSADKVVVVSDGEVYIKKLVEENFPFATHLLDFYHLKHKIGSLIPKRDRTEDEWKIVKTANKYIDEVDFLMLARTIDSWEPRDEIAKQNKKVLMKYIINNRKLIENHANVEIHGSGQIEKGVDLIVSRRLKNRAMGWTIEGANNMLKFKSMEYSREEDNYWKKRRGEMELVA